MVSVRIFSVSFVSRSMASSILRRATRGRPRRTYSCIPSKDWDCWSSQSFPVSVAVYLKDLQTSNTVKKVWGDWGTGGLTRRGDAVLGRIRKDDPVDNDPVLLGRAILLGPRAELLLLLPADAVQRDGVLFLAYGVGAQVQIQGRVGAELLRAPRTDECVEVGAVDVLPLEERNWSAVERYKKR